MTHKRQLNRKKNQKIIRFICRSSNLKKMPKMSKAKRAKINVGKKCVLKHAWCGQMVNSQQNFFHYYWEIITFNAKAFNALVNEYNNLSILRLKENVLNIQCKIEWIVKKKKKFTESNTESKNICTKNSIFYGN